MGGMNEVAKFLVYGLIDPRTNELRYVGKSSHGLARPHHHCIASGRKGRTHKDAWLRQLWTDGERLPCILVLQECESEAQALAHEIRLIALFREAGFDLTNLTDGGEGGCGHAVSVEARAKMSAAHKGKRPSPETLAKLSAIRRGREVSPDTRAKMAAVWTQEKRAEMSATIAGRRHTEQARRNMSAAQKGHKVSAETCAKLSAWVRTPELRARMSLIKKGKVMPPETRAKISVAVKAARARLKQERQKALLTETQEGGIVPPAQETRKESSNERDEKQTCESGVA